jgi:hypothetical protein
MSQRQGEAAALGNIGLIYLANGELGPAARQCFTEALRILGQHRLWRGRDICLAGDYDPGRD